MPVKEMARPMPVLNGSEYRERNTMKKQVKENTAGMNKGTLKKWKNNPECNERVPARIRYVITSLITFFIN